MILAELVDYVGLDAADRAHLAALHDRLAPDFPAIADAFYAAIAVHPGAARIVRDEAQLQRLHATLVDWMSTGLRGPYDDAFEARRSRIGRRHVEIGLAQHYMFGGISVIRCAYGDRIAQLYPADEARAVTRAVGKLLDIELALMLQHYQLDQVAALQRMTTGLAHEVRNPLNAAALQLELAERRLRRGDADPAPSVATARAELRRLSGLLDEFLAFAQPSPLDLALHDVAAIAQRVADRAAPGAVTITAATDAFVVDAAKVERILANLVENAIEAAGHAEIAVAREGAELVIRVHDHGPGIPAEVRARVFEPFFTTKAEGSGMGLAVVHAFAHQHGGSVSLLPETDGTTMEVRLP